MGTCLPKQINEDSNSAKEEKSHPPARGYTSQQTVDVFTHTEKDINAMVYPLALKIIFLSP